MRDGRYSPYVNWGKVNATLPKGKDPQSVTVEEALALLEQKGASRGKKKAPAKTKSKATKATAKTSEAKSKTTKSAKASKAAAEAES